MIKQLYRIEDDEQWTFPTLEMAKEYALYQTTEADPTTAIGLLVWKPWGCWEYEANLWEVPNINTEKALAEVQKNKHEWEEELVEALEIHDAEYEKDCRRNLEICDDEIQHLSEILNQK